MLPVVARPPGTADRQMPTGARAALVVALIYLFLVGVSSLEAGIKIMGADTQERLFSAAVSYTHLTLPTILRV